MHYVYILRCVDDSFYVGSTQDLDSRVQLHNDGRGAAYTFKHGVLRLFSTLPAGFNRVSRHLRKYPPHTDQ